MLRSRKAQEAPCFRLDVAEVVERASRADDIEQVAMLAGRGVGLMFNCT